jgi:hypothetical protein
LTFLSSPDSSAAATAPAPLLIALYLLAMPSFSLPQFDARRVRSYLFRLPLCTRALLVVIVAFWIASLRLSWFQQWAALIPNEMNLGTSIYRPSCMSHSSPSDRFRSVPIEYLPSSTCWLHTHVLQHPGSDSPSRTFRSREWFSPDSAPLHRPFVFLILLNYSVTNESASIRSSPWWKLHFD